MSRKLQVKVTVPALVSAAFSVSVWPSGSGCSGGRVRVASTVHRVSALDQDARVTR